jgi:hypothetical protein
MSHAGQREGLEIEALLARLVVTVPLDGELQDLLQIQHPTGDILTGGCCVVPRVLTLSGQKLSRTGIYNLLLPPVENLLLSFGEDSPRYIICTPLIGLSGAGHEESCDDATGGDEGARARNSQVHGVFSWPNPEEVSWGASSFTGSLGDPGYLVWLGG